MGKSTLENQRKSAFGLFVNDHATLAKMSEIHEHKLLHVAERNAFRIF